MKQATQPTIRWMIQEDLDQVIRIGRISKSFIRRFLRGSKSICSVVTIEDKVVGAILYEIGRQKINIRCVAVDEDFRKTKIATKLINNLIHKLNGHRDTILTEVPEHNLCAQLFFKKMGFVATNIIKNSEGDTYKFKYLLK